MIKLFFVFFNELSSKVDITTEFWTYWTRNWTFGVRNILIVDFPGVLLQVEIATKSLLTNVTGVRLVIVVSVHVEREIVNLK